MRWTVLAFLGVLTALPALAQETQIYTPPISAPPTLPVGTPTATVPATGTVITAPATAAVKVNAGNVQLEDIGFDPKVKRDPNGNIIKEGAPVNPITEANTLRTDSGSSLRSDSAINHPPVQIPQPVKPVTPITVQRAVTTTPPTLPVAGTPVQ